MLATLAFGLEMTDGSEKLDARAWKAVALGMLERRDEGLIVCDERFVLLYCSRRAVHLLGRLGMGPERILPVAVLKIVEAQLEAGERARVVRVCSPAGGSAIEICASLLRGAAPARTVINLREERLRDDELFAVLAKKFAVSLRGFQLAQLVRRGLTNRQIAEQLHLSESTVKIYLHQLYRACGVSRRTELVALLDGLSR